MRFFCPLTGDQVPASFVREKESTTLSMIRWCLLAGGVACTHAVIGGPMVIQCSHPEASPPMWKPDDCKNDPPRPGCHCGMIVERKMP